MNKHRFDWGWDSKFGHYATCEPCSWASTLYPTKTEAVDAATEHMLADWGRDG